MRFRADGSRMLKGVGGGGGNTFFPPVRQAGKPYYLSTPSRIYGLACGLKRLRFFRLGRIALQRK